MTLNTYTLLLYSSFFFSRPSPICTNIIILYYIAVRGRVPFTFQTIILHFSFFHVLLYNITYLHIVIEDHRHTLIHKYRRIAWFLSVNSLDWRLYNTNYLYGFRQLVACAFIFCIIITCVVSVHQRRY